MPRCDLPDQNYPRPSQLILSGSSDEPGRLRNISPWKKIPIPRQRLGHNFIQAEADNVHVILGALML